QAHQNGFGAAARFQPENRTPVIEQIEFDIAAAAVKLILPFVFAIRLFHPALNNRKVSVNQRISGILDEGKILFLVVLKIVEEYSGDTSNLTAMLQRKVLVTPCFEAGVKIGIMTVARLFEDTVKM